MARNRATVESGTTHEVAASAETNAVWVQTIHAAKGLKYPIVILANMNAKKFPLTGGSDGRIVFDDWRWDVLKFCRPKEYDEERRLLYVAMMRAEDHLMFTAGEELNTFFEERPVEVDTYEPTDVEPGVGETARRGSTSRSRSRTDRPGTR